MYEKNALNNFKDVLGKYCAINQFVELSKRCFVVEHQNEIQKRDTFVELATEYAVTLTIMAQLSRQKSEIFIMN